MEEVSDMAMLYGLRANPGGSPEVSPVERLLNEFESHEAKEENALTHYKEALANIQNPVTRLVLQLIVSDEEKHRAVTHALIATLKGSLTWTKPAGSLDGEADLGRRNRKLLATTEELVRLEKEGITEYKKLVEESSGYYHGLFNVLLDSMIRDSEKHIALLEFLRERLKEQ